MMSYQTVLISELKFGTNIYVNKIIMCDKSQFFSFNGSLIKIAGTQKFVQVYLVLKKCFQFFLQYTFTYLEYVKI